MHASGEQQHACDDGTARAVPPNDGVHGCWEVYRFTHAVSALASRSGVASLGSAMDGAASRKHRCCNKERPSRGAGTTGCVRQSMVLRHGSAKSGARGSVVHCSRQFTANPTVRGCRVLA